MRKFKQKQLKLQFRKGVEETAFNVAIDSAIEKTKTANKNINDIDNSKVFSEESKEVFNSASSIATQTKTLAETLNKHFEYS